MGNEQKTTVLSHVNEHYPWIDNAEALVLFSQDCDLLNPSLENEPFAEFFCVTFIAEVNPSLAYGKNPREIHLRIGDSQCICLSINHRIRIDRELLAGMSFDHEPLMLLNGNLKILLSWLSKKYSRPAFPDRFNELLAQIPKLDKKLLTLNTSFPTIKRLLFLVVPNTEVATNQRYSLSIKVLLDGRFADGDENSKEGISVKLRQIFSVKQIRILEISCDYEDEVTLFDLKYYSLWDKEYISRRYDLVL
ncbi:MAG: hypothetical protein JEY71_01550 [Sphaerochaeta sp.]|nr:hypothetical protein [Sphaerochaeta sp.]